jgi:small subunit ribosomal protein S20
MPTSKSAAKRVRTNEKSKLRNKARTSSIKSTEKKLRTAITSSDMEKAKTQFKEICSKLDKASKAGTVHKKKSSRKKSRLMSALNKAAKK